MMTRPATGRPFDTDSARAAAEKSAEVRRQRSLGRDIRRVLCEADVLADAPEPSIDTMIKVMYVIALDRQVDPAVRIRAAAACADAMHRTGMGVTQQQRWERGEEIEMYGLVPIRRADGETEHVRHDLDDTDDTE